MLKESGIVIPSHHLPVFADALRVGARREAQLRCEAVFESISDDPNYYFDVLGFEVGASNNFQEKLEAAFNRLLLSNPELTVRVNVSERDDLCRACAVGSHCGILHIEAERSYLEKLTQSCIDNGVNHQNDSFTVILSAGDLRKILKKDF